MGTGPDHFARIAEEAARRRILLCLDTSFRGFDTRAQHDSYEILEAVGGDYIVIEDTGKLWPTGELKAGFIATSRSLDDEVKRALSDVLLTVSPVILRLIEELAADAAAGGFKILHDLIARNREQIKATVRRLDIASADDQDARVSVSMVRFHSPAQAHGVYSELQRTGIHVLPCQQFYWAQPQEGSASVEPFWRATANSSMRVCAAWSRRRWRSPGRRCQALPEARARGVAQIDLETDVTDLGPGSRILALPVAMYRSAMDRALRRHKADALGYGANAGPLPAREVLARWSAEIEQADCDARNIFVTAGATHALDLLCSRLGSRGAVVLVQRTTYPLALDLFRARGLEPVPVGADLAVPAPEEFTRAVRSLRAGGRTIAFAYLQPTFHNPTGVSFSADDRMRLIAAARACGVTLVEDDPYRPLHFRSPPLPSLVSLSRCQGVIGVRTLSKMLGPGVRTGFLLADGGWLRDLGDDPASPAVAALPMWGRWPSLKCSTPATSQTICCACAASTSGGVSSAGSACPSASLGVQWDQPEGGFFAWLKLPDGLPASQVHDAGLKRGVRVLPGTRQLRRRARRERLMDPDSFFALSSKSARSGGRTSGGRCVRNL